MWRLEIQQTKNGYEVRITCDSVVHRLGVFKPNQFGEVVEWACVEFEAAATPVPDEKE